MVFKKIKTKILERGMLNTKMLIKVLQDHEDRLKALEEEEPVTRDLSFTVNDGTGPIEGATVKIGSKTGTTGSAGGCTITGVAEGTGISVEVSATGYTTKTETITVDSTHTSFTISLTSA